MPLQTYYVSPVDAYSLVGLSSSSGIWAGKRCPTSTLRSYFETQGEILKLRFQRSRQKAERSVGYDARRVRVGHLAVSSKFHPQNYSALLVVRVCDLTNAISRLENVV